MKSFCRFNFLLCILIAAFAARAEIKVLLMSGYGDPRGAEPGTPEARFACIQKPFTLESLAMKIREILDEH